MSTAWPSRDPDVKISRILLALPPLGRALTGGERRVQRGQVPETLPRHGGGRRGATQDAYEAFNEGGVEAILERLDPEIHVRERETMPDAATYHGREGFRKLFEVLLEAFDDVQYEVEEVVDRIRMWSSSSAECAAGEAGSDGRKDGAPLGDAKRTPVALTVFGTTAQAMAALDRRR